MTITDESELAGMEQAGRIVAQALEIMVRAARAGVTTGELDALAAKHLEQHGARSAPILVYDFPGTTCISVNEEVVHGIPGERRLRPGDIVTIDVTIEKDGFMADAARTVAIAPASRRVKRLAACSRTAFGEALRAARAGAQVREIGAAMERSVERAGMTVVRDQFGHGIGRSLHEEPSVPCFDDPSAVSLLVPGMVLAIEPIVSETSSWTKTEKDGWSVTTTDGSLAAHWENTVLITEGAPRILTVS